VADLFSPLPLRGVTLPNRVAMSPMCQYSAIDGLPNAWHQAHLGTRAVGGVGLLVAEASAVTPAGRISPRDAGIWSAAHAAAWRPITEFVASRGAVPAIQLAHAGFKASTWWPFAGSRGGVSDADGGWTPVGPTGTAFLPSYRVPDPLSPAAIGAIVEAFAAAAGFALAAGFRAVEVHAAHGYLLHEFYSPLVNTRADDYGGDFGGRTRFVREVVAAVRAAVGEEVPVLVRLSCTDWVPGGWTIDDTVRLATDLLAGGADLIDCSSGGAAAAAQIPAEPGYQVPFADRVRRETGGLTGAVGLITTPDQANEIVSNGRADIVLLGRELLRDPYWPQHAAIALGIEPRWPDQYLRAY
jgi:2,4-dienoyl-CoA reductase-like NADH-dependent reductase (Old Yellow Enzyme family)